MADLAYPAGLTPLPGGIQGRVPERYAGSALTAFPGRLLQDRRQLTPTTGTITDRVVFKSGASELPFSYGRVWLLRLADGYKAWEGWSDGAGWYTATGLELGVEYVAVGIDPYRNHRATGAGPVMAT